MLFDDSVEHTGFNNIRESKRFLAQSTFGADHSVTICSNTEVRYESINDENRSGITQILKLPGLATSDDNTLSPAICCAHPLNSTSYWPYVLGKEPLAVRFVLFSYYASFMMEDELRTGTSYKY